LVFVLDAVDAASSVQLRAQQLVSLDESIQFSAQVRVLSLEHASVAMQGLYLVEQVVVQAAVNTVLVALQVDIATGLVQVLLEALHLGFAVACVVHQVGVAGLGRLKVSSGVVALSGQTVIISHEAGVVSSDLGIAVTGAREFSSSLVELASLGVKLVASLLNQSVQVVASLLSAGNLSLQVSHLVTLASSLVGFLVADLLESLHFSKHLSTLHFD
jgi:hypothetical protein